MLHHAGFRLTLHPDRKITVRTADGTAVPHHPEPPWGDADQLDPTGTSSPPPCTPTAPNPGSTCTTWSVS